MRDTLKNVLFHDCPILFSLGKMGMDAPPEMRYGICFGIECGDGWYDLIREASLELEKLNKEHNVQIVAHQIKEKFGTLRYYLGPVPEELWDQANAITNKAEKKSEQTCEDCGKLKQTDPTVALRTKGWWRVECSACYEERKKTDRRYQPDEDDTE